MVAAGLARSNDWSWALTLRDTVLPELGLGHCGNNQAGCSTWVDRPEVIAFKRGGTGAARVLPADHVLGTTVSRPEIGAESATDKP